ncbi:MAG: site-specific integrase [Magnetococcales bacterium]|nr:site-specific integrase [Magnetococcales bacterium]
MATIEERTQADGKKVYRVKIRIRGTPSQTATFERKTDARRWATQTEAAIREGRYFRTTESQRRTVGEMLDRYLAEVLPGKSRSEIQTATQRVQLLWWKNRIGEHSLADLSSPLISQCRDELGRELTPKGTLRKPATVNRYLAALSHCLTIATNEWEWLHDNPMGRVRRPSEPRGRVRFLDNDERARLLIACRQSDSPFLFPVVMLALSTGARQGELLSLTWDVVDLERRRITLYETKNNEIRVLPLVGAALEEMQKLAKVRHIHTKFCFPGAAGNKPFYLRASWEKAVKDAELEDFHFHDLRHSCASYLAMNGASLAEIAEVLGHKTLQMVKRYAHLSEAHTAGVVERMNAKIFRSIQEVNDAQRTP